MQENQSNPQPSSTNSVPNKNPNLFGPRVCPRCGGTTDHRYCYACGCDLDPMPVMQPPYGYGGYPQAPNFVPPMEQSGYAQPQANIPPQQPYYQQQPTYPQQPYAQQPIPPQPPVLEQQPQVNTPPQQPYYQQPMNNAGYGTPPQQTYYQQPAYPQQQNYYYPMQPKKRSYWWVWLIGGIIGIPLIIILIAVTVAVANELDNVPYGENDMPYYEEYDNEKNKSDDDIFPGGISQKEFSQITKGMSYARVSKIIGGDGALTNNGTTPQGKSFYIYTWLGEYDDSAYVHITFVDDVVSDIVDDGLF